MTPPKAMNVTYNFCRELMDVLLRRKEGGGIEMGGIMGWAADRGYQVLLVNEDVTEEVE